jgi:nitrite reductase/ring-hydroxylating ferredoxin subunit
MTEQFSRRDLLKLSSATGVVMILTGCGAKDVTVENRGFLDRIMGRPITDLPQVADAWQLDGKRLTLDLVKLPELGSLGGAVRIEGDALADPILVVLGEDGAYYAFKNVCTHAGRMIDPLAGTMTMECCSVSGSVFDYEGNVLSGPAEGKLVSYALELDGQNLVIDL